MPSALLLTPTPAPTTLAPITPLATIAAKKVISRHSAGHQVEAKRQEKEAQKALANRLEQLAWKCPPVATDHLQDVAAMEHESL